MRRKDHLGDVIYAVAIILGLFTIVGRLIVLIFGN
jgi:hypothetical protein